jgi:Ribonuclease G/E
MLESPTHQRCPDAGGASHNKEVKPMDMNFVLKVLQSLALVASIARTSLDVVREVRELIKEYRHHIG